jgi:hypothetical protein
MQKAPRKRKIYSFFTKEPTAEGEPPKWRIKGSGVRGYPDDAPKTAELIEALKKEGIEVKEYSMSSPANVSSRHAEASFLDGGLYSSTGKYWFGEKGAWITGEQAFAFVVEKLGLVP